MLLGGTLAVFGATDGGVVVTAAWPLTADTPGLGADRVEPGGIG